MPYARRFALLILLVPAFGTISCGVPKEARAAGARWLLTDCEVGDEGKIEAILAKYKPALEPFFLKELKNGPSGEQIAAVEKESVEQYAERQAPIKDGNGLSTPDLADAAAMTQTQYVTQEREDFIVRYKSQAITGLGIVGGPKAIAALELLAKDGSSPLQGSALHSLDRLAGRKPNRGK